MAFNNNYYGGYPQQQSNNITVVTVQGENGANVYPVAAGNTVFLIDFDQKKFWIKATDLNGFPARFSAFEFKEIVKPPTADTNNFISRNEFDEWKNSTDATLNKILSALTGGKDNVSNAQ